MPTWTFKGGEKPPSEMAQYIKDHINDSLKISIEVESSHERLRRSFHALIKEWYKSGEWSANGEKIKTYEGLRDYYKLMGCDGKPEWYRIGKFNTKDCEEIKKHLPKEYHHFIVEEPKSWSDMTKQEKRNSLDILLTEIKMSMTSNKKVLEWVYKIQGDIDMLKDLKCNG